MFSLFFLQIKSEINPRSCKSFKTAVAVFEDLDFRTVIQKKHQELHGQWGQGLPSLKLTFSHLKMDGWDFLLSFWVSAYSQGLVSLREGNACTLSLEQKIIEEDLSFSKYL